MARSFKGIWEKLERTDQNIHNLQAEVKRFFDKSDYPVLPDSDEQALFQAIAYHKERAIPLRFSVLCGEIIHHMRSCFDHVVWEFSCAAYRKSSFRNIEFPVFETRPSDKYSISRYKRKIKGIANDEALSLIDELQPYTTPGPLYSPLLAIHNMDIRDKHRDLLLVFSTGRWVPTTQEGLARYQRGAAAISPADVVGSLKGHGKIIPQISFRDFCGREVQPVVPGLHQLSYFVRLAVRRFESIK